MRREFLKSYLLMLVAEGHMSVADLRRVPRRVVDLFLGDTVIVGPEVAGIVAAQGLREIAGRVSDFAREKLGNFADQVSARGLGVLADLARDLKDVYRRGAAAQKGK